MSEGEVEAKDKNIGRVVSRGALALDFSSGGRASRRVKTDVATLP